MSFRIVARGSIQTLNLSPWGGPGTAPRVRGRVAVDAVDVGVPTGVEVDGEVHGRLRCGNDPERFAETVSEMVTRVALLTGTEHAFELVYDLPD